MTNLKVDRFYLCTVAVLWFVSGFLIEAKPLTTSDACSMLAALVFAIGFGFENVKRDDAPND